MASTEQTINAVKAALSPQRMATYEAAAQPASPTDPAALNLYAWHAQVSAGLLAPLHICEVVTRNAVSEALEAIYGPRWPWSAGFEQSLPIPKLPYLYNPRRDLQNVRGRFQTTGKVIPELKFVFWQKLFTGRYDSRLWTPHLMRLFPGLSAAKTVAQHRSDIYADLDQLRELRNRIAHHEPIFRRNLADDFQRAIRLVEIRCPITAAWMLANQQAQALIAARP